MKIITFVKFAPAQSAVCKQYFDFSLSKLDQHQKIPVTHGIHMLLDGPLTIGISFASVASPPTMVHMKSVILDD